MEKKFVFSEAIKFAWEKMKVNFWLFVSIFIVVIIVNLITGALAKRVGSMSYIISIINYCISAFIGMGVLKITLKINDNQAVSLNDIMAGSERFVDYILTSLLYGLIIFGGLILLIVPGIIWSYKYMFMTYFVIDKNMKPMDAFRASANITNGQKMNLFLFGMLLALINLAGLLCLGVGLFFTIPTTYIATTYVYRKLLGEGVMTTIPLTTPSSPNTPIV